MPSWVDEKYTKREIGWIRIDGEWRPTVVLNGIPVQVTVDPRIGVGPLAEAWGPRVAEPSVQPQELDERAEGIASCLGHIVFQHGGSAELAGALQKWIRDHLDAPDGVTSPTARQRVAQRFIAEQMPIIRAAARTLGYAIAIHGTLDRDVDLVAIPWTAEAADADTLAAAVRDAMGGAFATTTDGRVQTEDCNRPHGRRTWAIGSPRLWGSYIDLSVMPLADADTVSGRPHRLTWNGTEWVAPCGCRYHPDDDNGSHGGAPHVHRCEKHDVRAPVVSDPLSEIYLSVARWIYSDDFAQRFEGNEEDGSFTVARTLQRVAGGMEAPPWTVAPPTNALATAAPTCTSLLGALTAAAVTECDHAVRQALLCQQTGQSTASSGSYDTCFRVVFERLLGEQPPIPVLLTCPQRDCGARHIDRGEFATKRHHTHTCQKCGHTWRPSRFHTVGVDFLPGFHDDDQRENDLRAEISRFCDVLENPDWKRVDEDGMTPEAHTAEQLRRILNGDRDGVPEREGPCR